MSVELTSLAQLSGSNAYAGLPLPLPLWHWAYKSILLRQLLHALGETNSGSYACIAIASILPSP